MPGQTRNNWAQLQTTLLFHKGAQYTYFWMNDDFNQESAKLLC